MESVAALAASRPRHEALHSLIREAFAHRKGPESWDFKRLVTETSRLFLADAGSLFIAVVDRLVLAATTGVDRESSGGVIHKSDQGLTGCVFATGEPLRLDDADDHVAGLQTRRFLAVPLRFVGAVYGVFRLSRSAGSPPFTAQDEAELLAFGDYLGAAIAGWDRLQFADGILDSSKEGIALSIREPRAGRPRQRILEVNPGLQKLLGYDDRAELLSLDASEAYAQEEYEKVRAALKEKIEEALTRGSAECGPMDSILKRADGTFIHVNIAYRLYTRRYLKPASLLTLAIARDQTKTQQLALQHNNMLGSLDRMGIAYTRVNAKGYTLNPTPADCRITGFSAEELATMSRENLYVDAGDRRRALVRARQEKGSLQHQVVRFKKKDGNVIWTEGDLRCSEDENGEEVIEGLYRDVSDRIALQGFVNASKDSILSDEELFHQLEKEAKFHLDYLASVGHQLQTPLSSVVETLVNIQSRHYSQQEIGDVLTYAVSQARACARLVKNLSYMDKILRGANFSKTLVPLAKLAAETKLDFLALLRAKGIEVEIDYESLRKHLNVHGNTELLRQVIVNLLDNAIKYSVRKSTVRICGYEDRRGPVLEVTNRGLSISPEDRERIFDRGYRALEAKVTVPHGTGLGLWLVREILRLHDARIVCDEIRQDGKLRTVFRVTFPQVTSPPSPRRRR